MAVLIQMAAGPAKAMMIMLSGQSAVSVSPFVGGLLFPYILKLSFSISIVRNTYSHLLRSSRLFFFQLTHIAFDATNGNGSSRFQRAFRLVYESLSQAQAQAQPRRNSAITASAAHPAFHDHSLHALSIIAL